MLQLKFTLDIDSNTIQAHTFTSFSTSNKLHRIYTFLLLLISTILHGDQF
jgi:hypothetical protein